MFGLLCMGISILATNLNAQQIPIPNDKQAISSATTVIKELSITDTPARSFPKGYNVTCNNPRKCRRLAKKYLRKDKMEDAVAFAAKGLTNAPTPRIERKLLSILTQKHYNAAYTSFLTQQKEYESNSKMYKNPATAKYATYLFWHSYRFYIINGLIRQIDNPKLSISLNEIPQERLGALTSKVSEYRRLAAKEYLENGILISKQTHPIAQKKAFHYFDISDQYVASEQAKQLRNQARENATITLFVASASYKRHHTGLANALDEQINAAIMAQPRFHNLTFFDLVSTKGKSDYVLKMVISEWEVLPKGVVTEKKSFSKLVDTGKKDDKGKAILKEVVSNISIYRKEINASATVTWEVVERQTGKIAASGMAYGSDGFLTEWATGNDTDVIPSRLRELLSKKQDKAPSKNTMIERAISNTASLIASQVMKRFIIKHGRRLDQ